MNVRLRSSAAGAAPLRESAAIALTLAAVGFALAGRAAEVPFGGRNVVSNALDLPYHMAAADLDGDGDLDLLAVSLSQQRVAWFENTDGAGSFGSAQTITLLAEGANEVVAADVDGDGDLDVLSASQFDDEIAWYENDGDGSFGGQQVITNLADEARSVAAADLDGDGDLDVLSASTTDRRIAWYENTDGEGSFGGQQDITTAADGAFSVVAADVDGDGDLDVLSASNNDDKVAWYENTDGSGAFGTQQVISTLADGAISVAAADLDGDGDLDVASASDGDDEIAWYENTDGAGTFGAQQVVSTLAAGAQSVAAADLDGDGDLDLLSASASDDEVAWYENTDGAGTFGAQRIVSALADGARAVAAADLDGDGDLDVLSASSGDDAIAWYPNQTIHRSAHYTSQQVVDDRSSATGNPRAIAAGDVDGDGDDDLVASIADTREIVWYANDGSPGGLGDWTSHTIADEAGSSQQSAPRLALADVDADGDLDLVAPSTDNGEVRWYENDGSPETGPWTARAIDTARSSPIGVAVGDLDGNGTPDVLATDGAQLLWYPNDGTPTSVPWVANVVSDSKSNAYGIAVADVDGDGDLDIVGGALSNTELDWYENDGTPGGLGDWVEHGIPVGDATNTRMFDVADVDGDGDVDVVAPHHATHSGPSGVVAWYENTASDGSAWTEREVAAGSQQGPFDARAVDLDGDGDVDIAVAGDRPDAELVWYESDGTPADGGWTEHVVSTLANGAIMLVAVDLDRDGDLDLAAAASHVNRIVWHANEGGQLALPTTPLAYSGMIDGQRRHVLAFTATHAGRSGDSGAELTEVRLRFTDEQGVPLSDPEGDALLANVELRRGDADGALVASGPPGIGADGIQTIATAESILHGSPVAFTVVATLSATSSSAVPDRFEVSLLTRDGSQARDVSADIPLSIEVEEASGSGVVWALPATGDADGDGLQNGDEATIHGTDPGSADTDADHLDDDVELSGPTDPLDPDVDGDGLLDGDEEPLYASDPLDPDSDDDGYCDGPLDPGGACALGTGDNCPAIASASQQNSDAFPAGDVCQCGDVTGNGPIESADRQAVREYLMERDPSPFELDRCDVTGDGACGVDDVAAIARASLGAPVLLENGCAAYRGP